MWKRILEKLDGYDARIRIVKTFLELGLRIAEVGPHHKPKVMCGEIEISNTKIARALGVDRRVVKETARLLVDDPELSRIFKGIRPLCASLVPVAKYLGFRVVEINADPHRLGIIAETASLLSTSGITIRQVVADDPDLVPDPKLTYVVEGEVPGQVLGKLLSLEHVNKVTAY